MEIRAARWDTQFWLRIAAAKAFYGTLAAVACREAYTWRGHPADVTLANDEAILLVVDELAGLVGTLAPASDCQAVSSANSAFVIAVNRCFISHRLATPIQGAETNPRSPETRPLSWLDWEERKQRRLLSERQSA
jgi:hypothetical protein